MQMGSGLGTFHDHVLQLKQMHLDWTRRHVRYQP